MTDGNRRQIKIIQETPYSGQILIGGRSIGELVRGYRLEAGMGQMPTLTLDLSAHQEASAEGPAHVELTPALVDLLKSLGWTPPGDPA